MSKLEPHVSYDPKDNVIDIDASGVVPSPAVIDALFDRLHRLLRGIAPRKPGIVTCWAGVELDSESAKRYGERMHGLKPLVTGFARYAVPEGTQMQIRLESIKHKLTTARSHFYQTRAEAIAAIRSSRP